MKTAESAARTIDTDRGKPEILLFALQELRYEISCIEQKHQFLGTDFTSLCDDAISRLQTHPPLYSVDPSRHHEECEEIRSLREMEQRSNPPNIQPGEPVILASTINHRNLLTSAFDSAGHYLEFGLDKMGDGIIFVFEHMLKIGGGGNGR